MQETGFSVQNKIRTSTTKTDGVFSESVFSGTRSVFLCKKKESLIPVIAEKKIVLHKDIRDNGIRKHIIRNSIRTGRKELDL